MALLRQHEPSLVLLNEVIKLAERLGHWERQLNAAVGSESEQDPEWLQQLRVQRHQGIQMGSSGCSDTYQSPAEECSALAHEENTVYSESEAEDLSYGVAVQGEGLGPDSDVLCYTGAKMEPTYMHQVNSSPPVMAYTHPAVPLVVGGQDFSYPSTGSAHIQTVPLHPVLDSPCANASGAEPSFGTNEMGVQVNAGLPATDYGQARHDQLSTQQDDKASKSAQVQPKQKTKSGWISSWFKSKPT